MPRYKWHTCSFSSGLDSLSRKQQRSAIEVLRLLKGTGRFSSFEVDNSTIAKTMDNLFGWSSSKRAPRDESRAMLRSVGGQYPWCHVELTERGEALLRGGS